MIKGSDPTKVKYKRVASSVYASGKEFAYDHVIGNKVVPVRRDADTRININVNTPRRSLKALLVLIIGRTPRGREIPKSTSSLT